MNAQSAAPGASTPGQRQVDGNDEIVNPLLAAVYACRQTSVVVARLRAFLPAETVAALTNDLPDELGCVPGILEMRASGLGIEPESLAVPLSVAGRVPAHIEAHDGAQVLSNVRDFIRRFCVFPDDHCLIAVTLWAAHAHMVQHFHTTPRLALLSPEAASGKTRVLEVLDLLVPQSLFSLNASSPAIFRTLAETQITLLFDEIDAIWTKRGQDDTHQDLRALLNAGYKRGATIPRCVGPRHDVVFFEVFCAVALAGLGDLPDTIMSRSIIVNMRPLAPTESVEPFRTRQHAPLGHALRERLVEWAAIVGEATGSAWPELPVGIVDRPAECWEPLLAVADAAGGEWPGVAREACVALCRVAEDRRASLGVRLLADLRTIFGDEIAMHSETIVDRLVAGDGLDDDSPWGDLHGKPLGKRGLASILTKYGVRPQKVKIAGRALQGYRREHLWDAWVRYLPPPAPAQPEPPELLEPSSDFHAALRVPELSLNPEPTRNPQTTVITRKVPEVPEVPVPRAIQRAESAPDADSSIPF